MLCAQSLSLPSSKFKIPILCTQSLHLPSSMFKEPTLSTQSLRLPSSKSKRPILCPQSMRLPSSKFKRSIPCTQSLRLPSSENGPQKKAIREDESFEEQWLLSAQRMVAGRRRAFFNFLTDFAGPVWQTDVSGTGCLY